jgi:hypothetical protein
VSLRGLSAGMLLLLALPLQAARLGDRVVPERYELAIAPDLANETFAGEETIDLQVRDPGRSFVSTPSISR